MFTPLLSKSVINFKINCISLYLNDLSIQLAQRGKRDIIVYDGVMVGMLPSFNNTVDCNETK